MSRIPKPATGECPGCGQRSTDGLLCLDCLAPLKDALEQLVPPSSLPPGVMPWENAAVSLVALLGDQLARLGQSGSCNGGRGASSALPFDAASRRALDGLRAALAMAVLDLGEGDGWPDDRGSEAAQLEAMAEWLLARLDRLRRHPRSAAMCDEITAAVRRGRRVLDPSAVVEYAGACELCGGALFARAGAEDALCQKCERVVNDAPARRSALLGEAAAGLATRDDILDALPISYGLVVNDQVFRGWVRRGRLAQRGIGPGGEALWRLGEVLELAREREEKRRR